MTSNGQAVATEAPRTSAADHVAKAERLLERAESWDNFERWPMDTDERLRRTANDTAAAVAHATLAVALADQRIADDEDRIASCVPDGLGSLSVSVRGQR